MSEKKELQVKDLIIKAENVRIETKKKEDKEEKEFVTEEPIREKRSENYPDPWLFGRLRPERKEVEQDEPKNKDESEKDREEPEQRPFFWI